MAKFGISIYVSRSESLMALRERLERIRVAGFTHAELRASSLDVVIDGQLRPERVDLLQRALEGTGLGYSLHGTEIASGRGGNLMDITSDSQRMTVEADIELAHAIGASVVVYHSGMLREEGGDPDAVRKGMAAERTQLQKLGDTAGQYGLKIAVENRDPVSRYIVRHAYGIDLYRLAEHVQQIDHPHVGVCFDTGHAYLASSWLGSDFLEDVRTIAPMVNHIHVSDNFGKVMLDQQNDVSESLSQGLGDLHLMPGWGTVPLEQISEIPFPGDPISILELRPTFGEHLEDAARSMERFGKHVRGNMRASSESS